MRSAFSMPVGAARLTESAWPAVTLPAMSIARRRLLTLSAAGLAAPAFTRRARASDLACWARPRSAGWPRAGTSIPWNLLAQQTLMARNSRAPVTGRRTGRCWTDGLDGFPLARQRLLQAAADRRWAARWC